MPALDLGPSLRTAGQRLVRSIDQLPDEAWAAPSLLPGWSRAHVVAHLTLNAEALAGCVEGALAGEQVAMYASAAARDQDIAELAGADVFDLRERLLASTTLANDALTQLAQVAEERPEILDTAVERDPGGRSFVLAEVSEMRLREVEVHHADLDTGYGPDSWPGGFGGLLIDAMAARAVVMTHAVLAPDDDPRRWTLGSGGPVVSGPVNALAWWVSGRPAGPELTSDSGALPQVEEW